MSESAPDRRVPAYLRRVPDADGEPAGTCFQLALAIVATARRVPNGVGAGAVDAEVAIDPLAGGESQAGTVVAIDPPADLVLVRLTTPVGALIAGLAPTDDVAKAEPLDVTGVSQIDDPGDAYRFLDGPGTRGGATLRDDARHWHGWGASSTTSRTGWRSITRATSSAASVVPRGGHRRRPGRRDRASARHTRTHR